MVKVVHSDKELVLGDGSEAYVCQRTDEHLIIP